MSEKTICKLCKRTISKKSSKRYIDRISWRVDYGVAIFEDCCTKCYNKKVTRKGIVKDKVYV